MNGSVVSLSLLYVLFSFVSLFLKLHSAPRIHTVRSGIHVRLALKVYNPMIAKYDFHEFSNFRNVHFVQFISVYIFVGMKTKKCVTTEKDNF